MFKKVLNRYTKKVEVCKYYADGSLDRRDAKRLKPMTRIRKSMKEIELERSNSAKLKIKDWYFDIDRGYSK